LKEAAAADAGKRAAAAADTDFIHADSGFPGGVIKISLWKPLSTIVGRDYLDEFGDQTNTCR